MIGIYSNTKYSCHFILSPEAVVQRCSVKKVFLKISQNSQENTCAKVSLLIKLQAQLFSCEFCEFFKNTFFIEHFRWFFYVSITRQ